MILKFQKRYLYNDVNSKQVIAELVLFSRTNFLQVVGGVPGLGWQSFSLLRLPGKTQFI